MAPLVNLFAIVLTVGVAVSSAPAQSQPAVEAPSAAGASSRPATAPSQQVLAETRPATRTLREGGVDTLKQSPAGDLAWKLISSAVVVLVLGAVCFVVMRRVVPRLNTRGGRNIQVIETAHLGPQKMVHLLKAGGRLYLVASTRDRISLLAELPPAASFQEVAVKAGLPQATKGDDDES
jgi:flagellar biogenesis protein FliO